MMNAMTDEMLEQVNGGSKYDTGDALCALFFCQIPGLIYYIYARNRDYDSDDEY